MKINPKQKAKSALSPFEPEQLAVDQFLTDLQLDLSDLDYLTHIESPTGTGKSTFVLEYLAKTEKVIFLVPQRTQWSQLKAEYGHRVDIQFYAGGHNEGIPNKRVIIAILDQLPFIMQHAKIENYVLVIDEVHKFYQAAGYRDAAISFAVDSVMEKRFKFVLTLSATVSRELLPFEYDRWITVNKDGRPSRNIEVRIYNDTSERKHAVSTLTASSDDKSLIVRGGNIKDLERLQKTYELKGSTCMLVSSQLQTTENVKSMLETGEIPEGINTVFTTSLLDEAVNINSTNIDSVHILGPVMHMEELDQFVGRFRKQNPKVVIHLSLSELSQKYIDLQTTKNHHEEIAKSLLNVFKNCQALGDNVRVKSLNLMVKNQGRALNYLRTLPSESGKYEQAGINYSALSAALYRRDMLNQYCSEEVLVSKIQKQFKDNVEVTVTHVESSGGKDYKKQEAIIDALLAEEYAAQLEECVSDIKHVAKGYAEEEGVQEASESHVLAAVKHLSSQTRSNSVKGAFLHKSMMLMSSVLHRSEDAFNVLRNQQEDVVWRFWETYREDPLIRPLLKRLKDVPSGTRYTRGQAMKLLTNMYREHAKEDLDFKDMVSDSDFSGIKVKKNNHFKLTSNFVGKVFRHFTNSKVGRDYIDFQGLEPFGYEFKLDKLERKKRAARLPNSKK